MAIHQLERVVRLGNMGGRLKSQSRESTSSGTRIWAGQEGSALQAKEEGVVYYVVGSAWIGEGRGEGKGR